MVETSAKAIARAKRLGRIEPKEGLRKKKLRLEWERDQKANEL